MEENQKRWWPDLERCQVKVCCSKEDCMNVDVRNGSGMVKFEGIELLKEEDFKF